jgi:hypothetical protein
MMFYSVVLKSPKTNKFDPYSQTKKQALLENALPGGKENTAHL